jgi:hypothetical protein
MSPLAIVIVYLKQSLENWAEAHKVLKPAWHLPRLRQAVSQRAV